MRDLPLNLHLKILPGVLLNLHKVRLLGRRALRLAQVVLQQIPLSAHFLDGLAVNLNLSALLLDLTFQLLNLLLQHIALLLHLAARILLLLDLLLQLVTHAAVFDRLALHGRNLVIFSLKLYLPLIILRQQLVVGVNLLLQLLLQPLRFLR